METLKIICYGCGQKLDVSELTPFRKLECPVCHTRLIVPKRFGNFLLESIIGAGDLATAYRANDMTLDREVVVKILNPTFREHPDVPQLYLSEARTASAINHPHVVPIFSCGDLDGESYVLMQFMTGFGLDRQIDPGSPPPLHDCCRWFMDAAKGLDAAALHGMLHHNLRPSNILQDMEGNVKVSDFGLALALSPIRPILRSGRPNVGHSQALYYSPERLRTGRQDVSGDIYSFGVCFYHVLTGHAPFAGDSPDDIMATRDQLPTPSARKRRPDVPTPVDKLIRQCLAPDPEERPQTYAEIVLRLKDALSAISRRTTSSGVPVRPPPRQIERPVSASTESRARTKVLTVDANGIQRVHRRHPLVRAAQIAIPCLVIVVIVLLIYFLLQQRST